MSDAARVRSVHRRIAVSADWWLSGGALGPVRRFIEAAVVAVGPWIVFVLALAIISISSAPLLGRWALEDLRLTVTYSFCAAPLAAGAIGLAVAELARRTKEDESDLPIFDIYCLALILAGGMAGFIAWMICHTLGIDPHGLGLTFCLLSAAAAMLWVCFAVLSALKLFGALIQAFLGGIFLSVVGAIIAVRFAPSVQLLVMCFAAGLIYCVSQSFHHVRPWQTGAQVGFRDARNLLFEEIWRRRVLSLGVTLALVGIWADKWVYWFGSEGMRSASGFLHFSRYDSVMFVAHLSMIPTFAAVLMLREQDLSAAYRVVQFRLQERSNHGYVRNSVDHLQNVAWQGAAKILFVQATIAGMLVLMAPWIARGMSFDFQQFLVLRLSLVAIFLFATFHIASSYLLLCGRTWHFLGAQAIFTVSNTILSIGFTKMLGFTGYPLLLSSLIAAIFAWPAALRSLGTYDYLYLLGENESLYDKLASDRRS
jgi:uncharacterized membrane protein